MAAISVPRRRSTPVPLPGSGWLNRWVVGAVAVLGLAGVLPVLQNSVVTSRGFTVQRIDTEQAQVQREISVLQSEVAALTSLQRVLARAEALGFAAPIEAPIYVAIDEPGPAPVRIPSEYLPAPVRSHGGDVPWWQTVLSWVGLGE